MKYVCKRCGKEFEAKHKTAVCADCHTAVCIMCGEEFQLQWPWTQKTCSGKCRGEYVKLSGIGKKRTEKAITTLQNRYGVSNPQKLQQVFTKTCKCCGKEFTTTSVRREYCDGPHYGKCPVCGKQTEIKEMYLGPQACSEECRMKRIYKTNVERYGCKDAVNSNHARKLAKKTCLEKYGVDHYSKTDEFRIKYRKTMLDKYGTTTPLQNKAIRDKLIDTCLAKYGVEYNCMRPECRSSYKTISKVNMAFSELLNGHDIKHTQEFPLNKYSYDFKIGNILVEVNPSITHNSEVSIFPHTDPIDSNYHANKTQCAVENGYRCIHVWDWDDWDKVVDLLVPCIKIGARKCEVVRIDQKTVNIFTGKYHINGSCKGQLINYGLYYNNTLIEVMTFGKPRYNRNYDYELLRLCTMKGSKVVGGASKLFNRFISDNPEKSVISYCDISKFTGSVYEQMGMTFLRETSPNKIWSKNDKKITQNLLNQRGYDQLFNANYGKGSSNEELMLEHGWLPVYDCGQAVYEYRTKN